MLESANQPIKTPAEVAVELYNVLFPHPSDVRQRAIQSAMVSLGETLVAPRTTSANSRDAASPSAGAVPGPGSVGPRAEKWLDKHGITREMLDEVFYISEGGTDIIASEVPGSSKREMTINCYLLCGIRGLLAKDHPAFDDAEAIALCRRLTAYDKNNHTTNRNAIGNRMSGTRPTFTLTGPGETIAAQLLKQMTASKQE